MAFEPGAANPQPLSVGVHVALVRSVRNAAPWCAVLAGRAPSCTPRRVRALGGRGREHP